MSPSSFISIRASAQATWPPSCPRVLFRSTDCRLFGCCRRPRVCRACGQTSPQTLPPSPPSTLGHYTTPRTPHTRHPLSSRFHSRLVWHDRASNQVVDQLHYDCPALSAALGRQQAVPPI